MTKRATLSEGFQNLSTEELIKKLNEDVNYDEVRVFLEFFGIQPGEHKVSITALNNAFNSWAYKKLFRTAFGRLLHNYIPYDEEYVLINYPATVIIDKARPKKDYSFDIKLVREFLRTNHIKRGHRWVRVSLLKEWLDNPRPNKKIFLNILKVFFDIRRTNKTYYAKVNYSEKTIQEKISGIRSQSKPTD